MQTQHFRSCMFELCWFRVLFCISVFFRENPSVANTDFNCSISRATDHQHRKYNGDAMQWTWVSWNSSTHQVQNWSLILVVVFVGSDSFNGSNFNIPSCKLPHSYMEITALYMHTHTHIYIYLLYIYMCVCVFVFVYIYYMHLHIICIITHDYYALYNSVRYIGRLCFTLVESWRLFGQWVERWPWPNPGGWGGGSTA